MATDNPLRSLFEEGPTDGIDVAAVLRRSRARRRPRLALVSVGSVLTASALIVAGVGLAGGGTAPPAADAAGSAPMSDSIASDENSSMLDVEKRSSARDLNQCGAPVAVPEADSHGLSFTVSFPATIARTSQPVEGTVTMTNTGTESWTGYTAAAPAITVVSAGVVIWHSNGPSIQLAREVTLAPGDEVEYRASLTPVVCGPNDEAAEDGFDPDLPAAPAGTYEVYAAIDLQGDFDAQLIVGGPQSVAIE